MENEACQNNGRQLWQESDEKGHRSMHVTEGGGIGINVGGSVWVKPLSEWHRLAEEEIKPSPAYLVEHDKQLKSALGYCEYIAKQNDELKNNTIGQLAICKNRYIHQIGMAFGGGIEIRIGKLGPYDDHKFQAPTYAACEQLARAFLETLKDVNKGEEQNYEKIR